MHTPLNSDPNACRCVDILPPTPRTDAEIGRIENDEKGYQDRFDCYIELIKWARKLERENQKLRNALEFIASDVRCFSLSIASNCAKMAIENTQPTNEPK